VGIPPEVWEEKRKEKMRRKERNKEEREEIYHIFT
jgi:hypothetical protein